MFRQSTFAVAVMALAAVLSTPVTAAADEKPVQGLWLATTGEAISANGWGRLVVRDGMLTFHGARGEFSTPLAVITRVSVVKGSANTFEILTVNGDRLQLSILTAQMLTESPKKAMQVIQRAVREAPAVQRPVMTVAAAPAGGSSR